MFHPRWTALFALLAACSGHTTTTDAGADAAPAQDAPSAEDAPAAEDAPSAEDASAQDSAALPDAVAPATCADRPGRPGNRDMTVTSGGHTRRFRVHAPPGYDPARATMLVLNFHGYTSNGMEQAVLSQMDTAADSRGFLVVYPEGLDNSWNAGACCGRSMRGGVDDVGFVRDMLDALERDYCVDRRRVFATGMSNGGFLSHRLACELADRIAAIGPVAGVIGVTTCTPARPVPVVHFHGTNDHLVPYNGSRSLNFPSVADTIAGWAMRDGCDAPPVEVYRMGDSHCETRRGCTGGAEVTLCTVEGGGHTWPGGTPVPSLGHTTQDLNATNFMLDFFARHAME